MPDVHLCQRGAISESGPSFAPVWTRQVRIPGPDSSKYAAEFCAVRMMRDVGSNAPEVRSLAVKF